MSANNMTRIQNASFKTLSSVRGDAPLMPGCPHIVTAPSLSLTTNWPTSIRLSSPSTVLRESLTKGPQVKEARQLRKESKVLETRAIGGWTRDADSSV